MWILSGDNAGRRRWVRLISVRWTKSQQHIAAAALMGTITGIHIEHAAGDGRTWPDDRTAMGLDTIDGVIFAAGIGAPDHMAVPAGIGAQGPIGGAGEHHAFDDSRRRGLRRR